MTEPRNLVYFQSDNHNRSYLGCYGHGLARTPVLDRMAMPTAPAKRAADPILPAAQPGVSPMAATLHGLVGKREDEWTSTQLAVRAVAAGRIAGQIGANPVDKARIGSGQNERRQASERRHAGAPAMRRLGLHEAR